MATKLEIINWSLRKLGKNPLDSLDEESGTAELFTDIYDFNRESLLSEFPWTFALTTVDLASTGVEPPDYTYEFQLPSDMLLLSRVLTNGLDIAKWDWTTNVLYNIYAEYLIRGDKLHINLQEVTIEYVYNLTNEELFDRLFVRCLALLLAKETAFTLTKDVNLARSLADEYNIELMRAKNTNAASGKRETYNGSQNYRKFRNGGLDYRYNWPYTSIS